MCYERPLADRLLAWLTRAANAARANLSRRSRAQLFSQKRRRKARVIRSLDVARAGRSRRARDGRLPVGGRGPHIARPRADERLAFELFAGMGDPASSARHGEDRRLATLRHGERATHHGKRIIAIGEGARCFPDALGNFDGQFPIDIDSSSERRTSTRRGDRHRDRPCGRSPESARPAPPSRG